MEAASSHGRLRQGSGDRRSSPHGGSQRPRASEALEGYAAERNSGLAQIRESNYDERTPQGTLTEVRATYQSCGSQVARVQTEDREAVPEHAGLAFGTPEALRESEEADLSEGPDSEALALQTPDPITEDYSMTPGQLDKESGKRCASPSSSSLVNVPMMEDAKAEEGDDSEPVCKSPDQGEESYERANEGDDSEAWPKPDREVDQHHDKGHDADVSLEIIQEQASDTDPKADEADDSEALPAPDKEVDQHYDQGADADGSEMEDQTRAVARDGNQGIAL